MQQVNAFKKFLSRKPNPPFSISLMHPLNCHGFCLPTYRTNQKQRCQFRNRGAIGKWMRELQGWWKTACLVRFAANLLASLNRNPPFSLSTKISDTYGAEQAQGFSFAPVAHFSSLPMPKATTIPPCAIWNKVWALCRKSEILRSWQPP